MQTWNLKLTLFFLPVSLSRGVQGDKAGHIILRVGTNGPFLVFPDRITLSPLPFPPKHHSLRISFFIPVVPKVVHIETQIPKWAMGSYKERSKSYFYAVVCKPTYSTCQGYSPTKWPLVQIIYFILKYSRPASPDVISSFVH